MSQASDKIFSVFSWVAIAAFTAFMMIGVIPFALIDPSGKMCHRWNCLWARGILWLVRCRLIVFGAQEVDRTRPYVIVSNHDGTADIPIFMSAAPVSFKFASKRTNFFIPLIGWAMAGARYVPIDRGSGQEKAKAVIRRLSGWLQRGVSVVLFPEGTRTRTGDLLSFKSGAFRLALQNRVAILPCAVWGSRQAMKADAWIMKPTQLYLRMGKPIEVTDFVDTEEHLRDLVQHARRTVEALREELRRGETPIGNGQSAPATALAQEGK